MSIRRSINGLVVSLLLGPLYFSPMAQGYFGLTARKGLYFLQSERIGSIPGSALSNNAKPGPCKHLSLRGKQRRLCKREPGIGHSLIEAARLSAWACQDQFKMERWNCSIGKHRLNILKRGFKETAFLYAISSAGLVHTFARACSSGRLDRCTCGKTKNKNTETWKLGGCGDNIKFGTRFSRRFLKARDTDSNSEDFRAKIDEHNTNVGLRIVKKNIQKVCRCHGASGSCSIKTCWKQLAPFVSTAELVKEKYDAATLVKTDMNSAQKMPMSMIALRKTENGEDVEEGVPLPTELVFSERSPSFCKNGRYSFGTQSRRCEKTSNCGVICCGRGYNSQIRTVFKPCNCRMHWCCELKCDNCTFQEDHFLCK
ncbi:protein Wnt-9a-like [Lineus longissimus]|uniref:protein Wnt-9a-like n=1 Tax=Lineus longissimus TaxID=88925 RepID=UPI002B4DBAB8